MKRCILKVGGSWGGRSEETKPPKSSVLSDLGLPSSYKALVTLHSMSRDPTQKEPSLWPEAPGTLCWPSASSPAPGKEAGLHPTPIWPTRGHLPCSVLCLIYHCVPSTCNSQCPAHNRCSNTDLTHTPPPLLHTHTHPLPSSPHIHPRPSSPPPPTPNQPVVSFSSV